MTHAIRLEKVTVGYDKKSPVLKNIDVDFMRGKVTAIIGPNGCGKSTLLRTINALIPKQQGRIYLGTMGGQIEGGDTDISSLKRKVLAQQLSFLEQSAPAPAEMTLFQLVKLGRYSHQSILQQWRKSDELACQTAMQRTGVWHLRHRTLGSVSGGQLQRTWLAMTLAQDAHILLLDEPISHLDITYQLECLDILAELNQQQHKTVIMVLHDVNLAARYAQHIILMNEKGQIHDQGSPSQIMQPDSFAAVFHIRCEIIENPISGTPLFIPIQCLERT